MLVIRNKMQYCLALVPKFVINFQQYFFYTLLINVGFEGRIENKMDRIRLDFES